MRSQIRWKLWMMSWIRDARVMSGRSCCSADHSCVPQPRNELLRDATIFFHRRWWFPILSRPVYRRILIGLNKKSGSQATRLDCTEQVPKLKSGLSDWARIALTSCPAEDLKPRTTNTGSRRSLINLLKHMLRSL